MTQEIIKIHGDTWKLEDIQADINWCKTQKWILLKYEVPHDHAHCTICWWTMAISDDMSVGMGYKMVDGNWWICQECFNLFLKSKK